VFRFERGLRPRNRYRVEVRKEGGAPRRASYVASGSGRSSVVWQAAQTHVRSTITR